MNNTFFAALYLLILIVLPVDSLHAKGGAFQSPQGIEDSTRTLRYHPEAGDFVIVYGDKRFTRALYGTYSGFRIEAGDQPIFAFYMPGVGGTLKLGITTPEGSKWLNNFY